MHQEVHTYTVAFHVPSERNACGFQRVSTAEQETIQKTLRE